VPDQQLFGIVDRSLRSLSTGLLELQLLCNTSSRTGELAQVFSDMVQRFSMEEHMIRARYGLNPSASRRSSSALVPGYATLSGPDLASEIGQRMRTTQELTRALEEYFQFFRQPRTAQFFRRLRFELYEYERRASALLGTAVAAAIEKQHPAKDPSSRVRQALQLCPLYFLLDESICQARDPLRTAFDAVAGGVRMMQLRFKQLATRELTTLARRVKQICAERDCLLIVNDRLDVALLAGADGIHLGDEDARPEEVRVVAPMMIIGVTARTQSAALTAAESGADYVGAGSVYPSSTKPGLPVIHAAGLSRIVQAVNIPIVGIGGITLENCARVMAAGAAGFCVVSPFTTPRSVKNLVQEFRRAAQPAPAVGGSK